MPPTITLPALTTPRTRLGLGIVVALVLAALFASRGVVRGWVPSVRGLAHAALAPARALAAGTLAAGVLTAGASASTAQIPSVALPDVPAGWPSTSLEVGMSDSPGGAAALRTIVPFGLRYQYLAGGVNTGKGWATWNPDGSFVTNYVTESITNQVTPVFTYYMIRQSAPGKDQKEADGVYNNLQNAATMAACYQDLELFFQRAGASTGPVVLHVEPDLWGYIEQRALGDDATSVPVQVASTGLPEMADLPDTAAGFAQAIIRLRDAYAPNVLLGYHLSVWGTGTDLVYSKPADDRVRELGLQAARYYQSLGADFDLVFTEFSDRDAAFKQYEYRDNGKSWWAEDDFNRNLLFLSTFVDNVQKRLVMWQIPLGNTRMRAMDNTWDHYQDNKVEWLLDDPTRAHLDAYMRTGVIAFLFGRGADGATCACDAAKDGVSDPEPINGNELPSVSPDDDGGFFRQKAQAYYAAGPLPLYTSGTPPAAALAAAPPAVVPREAPAPATASFGVGAGFDRDSVAAGETTTISAWVTSASAVTALVDVEVYDAKGSKVFQKAFDSQALAAGQRKDFSVSWSVPPTLIDGTYTAKVGVFAPRWGRLYTWGDKAAQIVVSNPSPPSFVISAATGSDTTLAAGQEVTVTSTIASATALPALVDVEIYDPSGVKIFQKAFDNQMFGAGQSQRYPSTWSAPATAGTYTVKVGVFTPGWGTLYAWNDNAAQITVTGGGA